MLNPSETALIFIGYQNDYFSEEGVLHSVIEKSSSEVLLNTLSLIEELQDTTVTMIDLPISFTPDYGELSENTSGILAIIRDKGAFQMGKPGSQVVPQIEKYRDRLIQVTGKRGLDGFCHTDLEDVLEQKGIKNIVLAGAVTSVCIDSTARSATEKGYHVTILSTCTSARSELEQSFFCSDIFPIYARVSDHHDLITSIKQEAA